MYVTSGCQTLFKQQIEIVTPKSRNFGFAHYLQKIFEHIRCKKKSSQWSELIISWRPTDKRTRTITSESCNRMYKLF